MPLLETRGAASVQGFGALAASARNYIEDVFSTYLYTGNGSTQTITNGIDLSGKGGLVWGKCRNGAATAHWLFDTARGVGNYLQTQDTAAQSTQATSLTAFNSNGFSLGLNSFVNNNSSGTDSFVSWTFRKQAKFFDVVTYTGDGVAGRTVAHNLGSVPGCIIVKRTDNTGQWYVYHRGVNGGSSPQNYYLWLNSTNAQAANDVWNNQAPTSSVFYLGGAGKNTNDIGSTYVAYLFAHDAGGFGQSGSDNVISCGSYTTDGSGNATVTLGYEPQFLIWKNSTGTADSWRTFDSMRGWPVSGSVIKRLFPNTADAEDDSATTGSPRPTATGFGASSLAVSTTYIYIAIRRGPMKTPTTGTSVYTPIARTGTNAAGSITTVGFPPDLSVSSDRTSTGRNLSWTDRLRGATQTLYSSATNGETVSTSTEDLTSFARMNGVDVGTWNKSVINAPSDIANWFFRRAPGFFDVVCYTGTGVNGRAVDHNLGVAPELIIAKSRGTDATFGGGWNVACAYVTSPSATPFANVGFLNTTDAFAIITSFNVSAPTSTQFTVRNQLNFSGGIFVAYLFASLPGISKVGSYTGTGNTLQIDCGFTGGARFVLIKRTDSAGDWYVWDSARGIVAGNDPYLLLNSAAAEVTSTDYVDTYSAGFEISSTAPAAINANGGSFIFLAIA